jgi:succinate dehydrogenase/fumarate reductase cytochrome b subunit
LEQSVKHLNDDDLVLHYFGEDGPEMLAVESHLQSCGQCAREYAALTRTLSMVTPPEPVEAPEDGFELRQLLQEVPRATPARAGVGQWRAEVGAIVVAWLVPVLYPLSLPALFSIGQRAHEHGAAAGLLVLTLLWACAGPLIAISVLHGISDSFDRASTRLLALGALMATISPPLFLLVSRPGATLWPWYGTLAMAAVVAPLPWPQTTRSTLPMKTIHRLSALLLGVFLLGHVVNQAIAFFSVSSYAAMRSVMRLASQQSISYTVIVSAAAIQMVTGAAMGMKKVRGGAVARNLQAVSGWYLAVFMLSHVFSGFLFSPPPGVPRVAASLTPINLLANPRTAAQLPFYLLGVAAFLFHVGAYARLAALAYFAEMSVRRFSYAAVTVATTIVVTIGLSLCGVHLLR